MCLKDNFYNHVNKKWLEESKIPNDRSSISAFAEIDLKNDEIFKNAFIQWKNGINIPNDKDIQKAISLYIQATDFEKREELGITPALKYIKKIEEIKDLEDLTNKYSELEKDGYTLPLSIVIDNDFKDPNKYIINLAYSNNILPERSYYFEEKEEGDRLLSIYKDVCLKILKEFNYTQDYSNKIISEALEFDRLYAEYTMTAQEEADVINSYNPRKTKELKDYFNYMNINKIIFEIYNKKVFKLNVLHTRFIENFNKVYNPLNFEKIKSWMILKTILSTTSYLTEKLRHIADEYSKALTGRPETMDKEKYAYNLARDIFSMPLGCWYGKNYFGEVAKKDVEDMVYTMIKVFKQQLLKNQWLSKSTIKKAIRKLNSIVPFIGYPDKYESYYSEFVFKSYELGGNLLDNIFNFNKLVQRYEIEQFKKGPDKELWHMPAYMVNAYFNPPYNQIVFPAGILQPPLYSINYTRSQNWGSTGATIAHEISHSFDNNGAKFDEKGRLNNWWTKEDLEKFEIKVNEMVKLFDGKEVEAGKCDGLLTVSENIADAGGNICALECLKLEKNYSLEEFFTQHAISWRDKTRKELQEILMKTDVHAPNELRCNIQMSNLDDFNEYYNLKEGDKMYLAPEKRVKIW